MFLCDLLSGFWWHHFNYWNLEAIEHFLWKLVKGGKVLFSHGPGNGMKETKRPLSSEEISVQIKLTVSELAQLQICPLIRDFPKDTAVGVSWQYSFLHCHCNCIPTLLGCSSIMLVQHLASWKELQ